MQDSEKVIASAAVANRLQCYGSIISTETDTNIDTDPTHFYTGITETGKCERFWSVPFKLYLVSVSIINAYHIRLSMSVLK